MKIQTGELDAPDVIALLRHHLEYMYDISPVGNVHAFDLSRLKEADITFWTARDGSGDLMGCGALKELTPDHGEVKSMRTVEAHLRKGVAAAILTTILDEARRRGYVRLSLETGATGHFAAAHRIYRRFGFDDCGPFAGYGNDPHSRFMTLSLT